MPRKTKPIPNLTPEEKARFWSKVDRRSENECWEWQGSLNRNRTGYGQVHLRPFGTFSAHRVAFALAKDDAGELEVLHTCDNPRCCNPRHLVSGTQAENIADMVSKGRWRAPAPDTAPQGIAHYQAKLTPADIRAIRSARGLNLSDLGRLFGVAAATIRDVLHRRTWKHVA